MSSYILMKFFFIILLFIPLGCTDVKKEPYTDTHGDTFDSLAHKKFMFKRSKECKEAKKSCLKDSGYFSISEYGGTCNCLIVLSPQVKK